ncbi:MAG: glycosyltransferase family 4 protein [Anaerolineae bacterium]
MNILFLSAWFPYPPSNGSKLRIYNLIRGLSEHGHDVTLISFTDEAQPDTSGLDSLCRAVYPIDWVEGQMTAAQRKLALFSATPSSFLDTYSQQMVDTIQKVIAENKFDAVVASQIKAATYSRYLQGLPAIFEEIELGVMYEQFAAGEDLKTKLRYGLTWFKHRGYMRKILNDFQACTVVSREEKLFVEEKIGKSDIDCQVIPNGVDVDQYQPFHGEARPNTLIYTGSFGFYANYDAMVWFVGEVLPLIQNVIPDVTLTITGDHKNLPLPKNDGVHLAGFVDDIRPLVAQSTISLAPLLTGGGTRLKILEAMALQTPVVATSKGAQGLDATPGKHCLIADSAQDFADAVIQLLEDANLAQTLKTNAYQLVQSTYDWKIILPQFVDLIECKVT